MIADFSVQLNIFFLQYRSKIVIEPTISHTTLRFSMDPEADGSR